MRTKDVISFAAFAAIIVFVLGYFATLGIRVKPPSERTNLSMEVADINGLVVGSNVLLRGVPIGKVTKIGTAIQAATVDFYVEGRYRIPVDSQIRLENLSALGESYISLTPHTAGGPMLHDGQHIAAQAVTAPRRSPSWPRALSEFSISLTPGTQTHRRRDRRRIAGPGRGTAQHIACQHTVEKHHCGFPWQRTCDARQCSETAKTRRICCSRFNWTDTPYHGIGRMGSRYRQRSHQFRLRRWGI
ncbi:mce related family protein [Mycobacterium xenopi 3993]|nr:mce related family protein [Mycobacterium xenopi 3993]